LHAFSPTHEPEISVMALPQYELTMGQAAPLSHAPVPMQELVMLPMEPPYAAAAKHASVPLHEERMAPTEELELYATP